MLSKKCQYALHALIYLGEHQGSGLIFISEIAASKKIPKKFLEAILLDLKRSGVLGSKQGKGGGYFLRMKPADVNLAEVVRQFDGAIALVSCAAHKFYEPCAECEDEETCTVHDAFLQIRNATVEMLKADTLESLVKKEAKLKARKKR